MGPRDQPLMLATEGGARWVELAFGSDQSSFPQQTSFPMFLANVLDWLTDAPSAVAQVGHGEVPRRMAK